MVMSYLGSHYYLYIGLYWLCSYQIHPSRRTQSSGWLGLTGSAAPRVVFGMVPSIRIFALIRMVLEKMVITFAGPLYYLIVENIMVVSYVGTMELFIYN